MLTPSEDMKERASDYASRRGITLMRQLGYGRDGTIFSTSLATAIKVHFERGPYERELACYHRLSEHHVMDVRGHRVPQLISWDDELLVIEMSVVAPPFLLDFASASLDTAPDFSAEVMEEWDDEKREQFGCRWEEVQLILAFVRGHYGIHLLDVNPGNIKFGEGEE
jgi:hypothetical protein